MGKDKMEGMDFRRAQRLSLLVVGAEQAMLAAPVQVLRLARAALELHQALPALR
jgi:hypothetical protein